MHRDSTAAIRKGLEQARWSISDLWVAALGIGGGFSHLDIEHIASGQRLATPAEHDILAAAFNDHFVDRGQDHAVRYWRQLPETAV